MKKLLSLLLALFLLISGCAVAEGVLVSTPVEMSTGAITADSLLVQDLYSYMQNRMTFGSLEKNKEGMSYRKFTGGKDGYTLIQEYVKLLTSGKYNFKLVDSYHQAYDSTFFSYALEYTGTGRIHGKKSEMNYTNGVYGHITIWGTLERSRTQGYIYASDGLEFSDLGLRAGGKTESVSLPGQSLTADLYRLNDGSYKTGDGRFHVKVGQAAVYRDGKLITTQAKFIRNQAKNREELHIDDFYRNESLILTVPYNSVMTGDILDQRAIGYNNDDNGYDRYMKSMEDFLDWRFSDKILGVCHNGEYFLCYCDDYNDFDKVAVRVMYWDKSADVAVFYICTTFDSAPYEYEIVAAVSLGGTPEGANADEVFSMKAGQSLDVHFSETEFMPSYELFKWEILEGSSLIELSGTRSQTCTVQAYDPGTVRLKVTYEYGAKGTNVLTGNPETKFLSKTREYVINIAPR